MPNRLEGLLEQLGSLPTIPSIIMRVTDLVNNPKTSALQLARVILDDQAMTARLLRLVNSPFYGFPRRIATVTEAITILGFHQVRNLLLTTSVVDLLSAEETAEFSPAKLWEHSVAVGVASGLLARQIRHEDREEVFVAGLLHDVGKLVEFQLLRKDFGEVLALAWAEDIPIRAAEQRVFGFAHDQAGRLLTEQWKLPIRLTEAIACHHRPDLAQTAKREAAIVHLADILARTIGLGSGGDDAVPPLDAEAWHRLKLPMSALDPLLVQVEEQYREAQTILLTPLQGRAARGERLVHAH
jgi:putative nucleotidyltransferase with HDIG domain